MVTNLSSTPLGEMGLLSTHLDAAATLPQKFLDNIFVFTLSCTSSNLQAISSLQTTKCDSGHSYILIPHGTWCSEKRPVPSRTSCLWHCCSSIHTSHTLDSQTDCVKSCWFCLLPILDPPTCLISPSITVIIAPLSHLDAGPPTWLIFLTNSLDPVLSILQNQAPATSVIYTQSRFLFCLKLFGGFFCSRSQHLTWPVRCWGPSSLSASLSHPVPTPSSPANLAFSQFFVSPLPSHTKPTQGLRSCCSPYKPSTYRSSTLGLCS